MFKTGLATALVAGLISTAQAQITPVGPFPLAAPPVAAVHCTMFTVMGDDRIWGIPSDQPVAGDTVMRAWERTPSRKLGFNSDSSSFGPCAGFDRVFRAFGIYTVP
jgi:hypothetical protein